MEQTAVRPDAGGKVKIALDLLTRGSARFSECGFHRTRLERIWGSERAPAVLFVGMNPSTADETANDPTVARECDFARRWGFERLVKVNWASRRATFPKDLLLPGLQVTCAENLQVIEEEARLADLVVLAHGVTHRKLEPIMAESLRAVLRGAADQPEKVVALGLTKEGFPRHSLYMPKDAIRFKFPLAEFVARLKHRSAG